MILAPIIGTAVGATDPNSAGSYAVLSGGIVGAAAIGAAGFIQTSKITLYGVELRFRQFIPASEGATFSDAGVILDYAVEFGVKIKEFGIETKVPLKVRYRAIGFNLNFTGGGYRPIFDTSKGYELNLSDPGLFSLPSPIDNLLNIRGARTGSGHDSRPGRGDHRPVQGQGTGPTPRRADDPAERNQGRHLEGAGGVGVRQHHRPTG
jgi:hypothetical protein